MTAGQPSALTKSHGKQTGFDLLLEVLLPVRKRLDRFTPIDGSVQLPHQATYLSSICPRVTGRNTLAQILEIGLGPDIEMFCGQYLQCLGPLSRIVFMRDRA